MRLETAHRTLGKQALAVFFVATIAITSGLARAEAPQIGDKLPDFQLQDLTGKSHSLSKYAGKIVVLNFCSQECPWSRGADAKINEVARAYADKGVVFLGIDSHHTTPTEAIKAHAENAGVPYPILKDSGNAYADTVSAQRTPEIFIVDRQGKLAYHGAFDNRTQPGQVGEVNYVVDALEALLAGREVAKPTAAAWGCTIKRAPRSDPQQTSAGHKACGPGCTKPCCTS